MNYMRIYDSILWFYLCILYSMMYFWVCIFSFFSGPWLPELAKTISINFVDMATVYDLTTSSARHMWAFCFGSFLFSTVFGRHIITVYTIIYTILFKISLIIYCIVHYIILCPEWPCTCPQRFRQKKYFLLTLPQTRCSLLLTNVNTTM